MSDPSNPSSAWTASDYAVAVQEEAFRIAVLVVRCRHSASDIAQDVAMKFLKNAESNMERYSNPVVFAHAATRTVAIDHIRRMNKQRGAGVHGKRRIDGDFTANDETAAAKFIDGERDHGDFADSLVDDMDDRYRLAEVELGIPADEWNALYLTVGLGYTDAEAADVLGVARETVNRRKQRGLKRGES